jgi:hypothetical protein
VRPQRAGGVFEQLGVELLDIRLDARLSDPMTTARAMQRGGVGWYPHSGFIHIDAGPIRNWTLDEHGLDAANSPSAVPERMSGRWWEGSSNQCVRRSTALRRHG